MFVCVCVFTSTYVCILIYGYSRTYIYLQEYWLNLMRGKIHMYPYIYVCKYTCMRTTVCVND